MAYKVTAECIACGECIPECGTEAISEGEEIYAIDAELCNDCAACVPVCPTNAIILIE